MTNTPTPHSIAWRDFSVPKNTEVIRRQVEVAVATLVQMAGQKKTAISLAATGHPGQLTRWIDGRVEMSADRVFRVVSAVDELWAKALATGDIDQIRPPYVDTAPPERGSGVAAPAPAVEPVGETCLTAGDGALGERIGCTSDGRARHDFQADRETANGE